MNAQKTVILLTGSYPYESAAEHTFLDPEMDSLCSQFERVIIIPATTGGKKRPVPDSVLVEESYARAWQDEYNPLKAITSSLFSNLFWHEISGRPQSLLQFQPLKRSLWISNSARFTAKWMLDFIDQKAIDVKHSIFYTYWLDHLTFGVGLAKETNPDIKLISRSHHYDLYEYFYRPPYIPFRSHCLDLMDNLYLISEDGKKYMDEQHPRPDGFYRVSRLGVKDPGFVNRPSDDQIFRIASCSFMVPFKRIDLLFDSLVCLAAAHPQQQIEWVHIGDGPLMPAIKQLIESAPANLKCNLLGHLPNQEVMSFYQSHPLDVLINVSQSEGIPVSIMEAQSCGLPVIATAVGGTPEIVNENNGFLLPKDATSQEIADTISRFMSDTQRMSEKRKNSLNQWRNHFNAKANFDRFAASIGSLVS